MGGFNHNQIRDILKVVLYEIINCICGERGGRTRGLAEGEAEIGVPFRRSQVFAWGSEIHLLQ